MIQLLWSLTAGIWVSNQFFSSYMFSSSENTDIFHLLKKVAFWRCRAIILVTLLIAACWLKPQKKGKNEIGTWQAAIPFRNAFTFTLHFELWCEGFGIKKTAPGEMQNGLKIWHLPVITPTPPALLSLAAALPTGIAQLNPRALLWTFQGMCCLAVSKPHPCWIHLWSEQGERFATMWNSIHLGFHYILETPTIFIKVFAEVRKPFQWKLSWFPVWKIHWYARSDMKVPNHGGCIVQILDDRNAYGRYLTVDQDMRSTYLTQFCQLQFGSLLCLNRAEDEKCHLKAPSQVHILSYPGENWCLS